MNPQPAFSVRIAVSTSIAQGLIIQAGDTLADVYEYVNEHSAEEILKEDAERWASPLVSSQDGCYEGEDGERTPLTLYDVYLAIALAFPMVSGMQCGDSSLAEILGESLRIHEEIWARRVGDALTELQAVTQIGLLSH